MERWTVPHHAASLTGRKSRELLVVERDVDVESSGCCCLILNGQLALAEQSELAGGRPAEPFPDNLANSRAINAVHESIFGSSDS